MVPALAAGNCVVVSNTAPNLQVVPALAAGNCVVVSPAAPLPALLFAGLCVTAGLPSGVLSVVIGEEARQVFTHLP